MTKRGNAGQHENVGSSYAPKLHSGHFARTQRAGRRRVPIGPVIMRSLVLLVLVAACFVVAPGKADAQTTTYYYRGNNFNSFSCVDNDGVGTSCTNPTPAESSYTTSDYVFASMQVNPPLAPNLNFALVYNQYTTIGNPTVFVLTMSDGQQTISSANANGFVAYVSTDAKGNIVSPWWVQIGLPTNNDTFIGTANNPGVQGVSDTGELIFTDTQWNSGGISGSPGAWFQKRSGTATWFYLEGQVYGLPFGPFHQITGGDGQISSTQWNFEIPAGWTYGNGQLNSTGSSFLSAGAYASSSGPCTPVLENNCNIATGAARGLAYETFSNTGAGITVQLNAALEGEFINSSGGISSAAVYVVDAGDFASTVPAGSAAASFLLANSSIDNFGGAGLSLGGLFPLGLLATSTATEQPTGTSSVSVPVTTSSFSVGAGENITVIFDVAAYAPVGTIGGGPATVNFASTLAPGPSLFTDTNGKPVTQIVAISPPLSTPPTLGKLALSTTTASAQVGTPATLTVTATDTNGNPLPNATVFFSITSGPDSPMSGPALTNASGQASFTYPGGGAAGMDSIYAYANAGAVTSNTVTVTWSEPGPLSYITISPANATTPVGVGVTYTTAAFDQFGNAITETGSAGFGISAGGSCTGPICSASTPGTYTVTATYSGVTAQTSLTVGSTPLTITASSPSMTYGGTVPAVTPLYTYGGLTLSTTAPSGLTTPPTCSTTATNASPVGSYPSSCTGAVDSSYTISYAAGSVTVGPAPLQITAASATMTYGGTVPAINTSNATYATFVNGDGVASLGVAFTCSTTATSSSPVASYPTTCSGAVDANYTISYVPGSVVVNAASLTIIASSPTMTYGGTVPTIAATYTYGGVTNSPTPPSGLTGLSCSTTATSTSAVGSYPTSCSGASDSNYTIGYAGGRLTVGQAALVITASSGSMTAGTTPPAITPSYGGFVAGNTSASLTTQPTCLTSVTSSTSPGTYTGADTCSGAVDPNYAISYVAGNMVVNPAGQTSTFTITPEPPAETVTRGVLGGFILKLQSVDGFNANVKLSCSGGPAGSYCVDFPMTVKVNGTDYAVSGILFPKNSNPGTYVISFTGVSGSLTVKATATFTVK
ncbi:MAG: MBG domain-containing protein [Terriglobia bacterium]